MPFKVQYEIFENKHQAPDYQTYDYTMAVVEWQDRKRNPRGMMWSIQQTVIPDGTLTKPEEYLLLVYRVRKLTIQYKNNGMKDADKRVLMDHVRRLDKWNRQTRDFLNTHCKMMDAETTKRMSFFILVEAWRDAYYERQQYSNAADRGGYDANVFREMTRKIRQFEQEIDKYIKDKLQLI